MLFHAIEEQNIKLVLNLIAQGVDLNWQNPEKDNFSPMHVAVTAGNLTMCDLLIQNGADCNLKDAKSWTPIHHITFLDKIDCLILFVRRSVKLDVVNNESKVLPLSPPPPFSLSSLFPLSLPSPLRTASLFPFFLPFALIFFMIS